MLPTKGVGAGGSSPPPPPSEGFVVMVNPWSLIGAGGDTINFDINGTDLGTWTVDAGTGNIVPTYETVVHRTDAGIVQHGDGTVPGSFLDEFTNARLSLAGPAWAGTDAYEAISSAVLLEGLNEITVTLTGPGIVSSQWEVVVARVVDGGAEWEWDGADPVLADFWLIGGELGANTFLFMSDGSVPPVQSFNFAQDDAVNFTISWDAFPLIFPGGDAWLLVEFSWDGVTYYAYDDYNTSPTSEQFNNYDPTLSPPTYDPVPFTPGNTYYMRARYQNDDLTPTRTGPWLVRSFVAT